MAQENNQQGYTCTGDCLRCSQAQRQYCASQFTFKNMRMLESMVVSIQSLSEEVKSLGETVSAIQNAEGELFNPSEQEETEENNENVDRVTSAASPLSV